MILFNIIFVINSLYTRILKQCVRACACTFVVFSKECSRIYVVRGRPAMSIASNMTYNYNACTCAYELSCNCKMTNRYLCMRIRIKTVCINRYHTECASCCNCNYQNFKQLKFETHVHSADHESTSPCLTGRSGKHTYMYVRRCNVYTRSRSFNFVGHYVFCLHCACMRTYIRILQR